MHNVVSFLDNTQVARKNIEDIVDDVYLQISQETAHSFEKVHTAKVCHIASKLIVNQLVRQGASALFELRNGLDSEAEQRVLDSYYLWNHGYAVLIEDGQEIIIDATWQQFLTADQQTSGLRRSLIGTRDDVRTEARSCGIAEDVLSMWVDKESKLQYSLTDIN